VIDLESAGRGQNLATVLAHDGLGDRQRDSDRRLGSNANVSVPFALGARTEQVYPLVALERGTRGSAHSPAAPATLAQQDLRAEAEQLMLDAITPAQVEELISLLEQLFEARKARATEGKKQTPDEIINDPGRRQLTDYLYALSDEARKELIALMLLGRGDFDHSYQNALETCSRYTSADDQVVYLMGKTVRLAEYLSIGLGALSRNT